jgi:hypothetical protein
MLKKKRRLKVVFGIRVLRTVVAYGTEDDKYFIKRIFIMLVNIISMIKTGRMESAGYVVSTLGMQNAYKILVGII